jgi:hypothetical protein
MNPQWTTSDFTDMTGEGAGTVIVTKIDVPVQYVFHFWYRYNIYVEFYKKFPDPGLSFC